jgi:hypothetical protein
VLAAVLARERLGGEARLGRRDALGDEVAREEGEGEGAWRGEGGAGEVGVQLGGEEVRGEGLALGAWA